MSFLVIPAIDLRGGRCIRLYQGDYAQETVYSDDPVAVARHWAAEGAPWLHVVDLDGAASGHPVHLELLKQVADAVAIPVQFGGGLRSLESIQEALSRGARRAILGSAALRDPALVKEACRRYGEAMAVSIDVRQGRAALHGWRETAPVTPLELARHLVSLGVPRLIFTDITRDGTLEGPNEEATAELVGAVEVPVLASGGIASIQHLLRLRELGAEGAIVGKALYTGHLNLKLALEQV